MRAASDALIAIIESGQFFMADLYTFTLLNGTVLRYTSFDADISSGGHTFSSALGWERTTWKLTTGLNADTMSITVQATPADLVNGIPVIQSIVDGTWDGAACSIDRAFMPTAGDTSAGVLNIFSGTIGTISEIGRIHCQMDIISRLSLLNIGLPKNIYQPSCRHNLFDAGCTLDRAAFETTGACAAGSSTTVIQTGQAQPGAIAAPVAAPTLSSHSASVFIAAATYYVTITYVTATGETIASPESSLVVAANRILRVASPPSATDVTGWNAYVGLAPGDGQLQNQTPIAIGTNYDIADNGIYLSGQLPPEFPTNGYWALGVIEFTSGANIGLKGVIDASDSSGAVELRIPMPAAPAAGDTYILTPGCDHIMSTCSGKFNNLINFGGQPFIPTPEAGA